MFYTMSSFSNRFSNLAEVRSPLCMGIDPSADLLDHWGLSDTPSGVRRFWSTVLEAADDLVAVIKPQMGFFERFGVLGLAEISALSEQIRNQGSLCLIDAKRGDFSRTMEGYAEAMFGENGGLHADAVTVSPYLGFGTLEPMIRTAHSKGAGVFVVVRSSNPEGQSLQNARLPDGRSISGALADEITKINTAQDEKVGCIGAVVGATISEADMAVIQRLPKSLILAPGVGEQGATMSDVVCKFARARGRTIPSVSRSILIHGPEPVQIRDAIKRYRDAAWDTHTAEGIR
jgi:orotidine-5'-phosphate decarboxylase